MDKQVQFDPQVLRSAGMQFSEENVIAQLIELIDKYENYHE
jgi:hypothetical protein